MHAICSQDLLAPALRAMRRIVKDEIAQSILLTASREPEQLTLTGEGMRGVVGVIKHLPAEVTSVGYVRVSVDPLAEYLSTLRPGPLTLRLDVPPKTLAQGQTYDPETASCCNQDDASDEESSCLHDASLEQDSSGVLSSPPKPDGWLHRLRGRGMLSIQSAFISSAGTASRYQARLPTWSDDDDTNSVVALEMAPSCNEVQVPAKALRRALALCTPFAVRSIHAPELAGVLVRLEREQVLFMSTDGSSVAAYTLPLHRPASHPGAALFDARALSWIQDLLPKEGAVTLSLRHEEQQNVLLLWMRELTAFCRALPDLAPPNWERVLAYPHTEELHMKRSDLVRALKGFTAASLPVSDVRLWVKERLLFIDQVPSSSGKDPVHSQVLLPLLRPAGPCVLEVNPAQLKRLVSKTSGEQICLQVGTFLFVKEPSSKKMGFVRLPCGQATLMMAIVEPSVHPSAFPAPLQELMTVGGPRAYPLGLQEDRAKNARSMR